jgi:predicted phage terminase large subunit-like protein
MVKADWFKTYTEADKPAKFEMIFQSWDTANKPTELSDYSVCTTWGVKEKHVYLLHVFRDRLGYPALKRAVREQADAFSPQTILIEDKASGTQLIQELVGEGMHAIKKYEPKMEKTMRMNSVTSTIENGFAHLPDKAAWLGDYLHELTSFPKGKYDDQADSTSQALDWVKGHSSELYGWFRLQAREAMVEEGNIDAVEEMDAKYGRPKEEAPTTAPSKPAVYNGSTAPQKPGGPVTYYGPDPPDPDSIRLKRRPKS